MGSSVHVNNKQKYILILGESATQGLDDTRLSTGKSYSIGFTSLAINFVSACITMKLIAIY